MTAAVLGLVGLASVAQAAISVGPGGSGNLNFTTPINTPFPTTDWTSLSVAGAAADHTTAVTLDAAVIANTSAAAVTVALAQSPTLPPSQFATARHNTNQTSGYFLQTRPTGNGYLILMATLQNDSGAAQSQICVAYDYAQLNPIPVNESPELAGLRAYYSLTGTPGSWALVTGLPAPDVNFTAARVSTTVPLGSWAAGSPLYIIWVDDNGPGSTTNPQEGAYSIDNAEFTFSCAPPPPVGISNQSSLTNQSVLQCRNSATMSVTATNATGYQWRLNGADIPGATAATYTITDMQAAKAGSYTVRVSGVGGPVTSTAAMISYVADTVPPTIIYALGSTNLTQITLVFSEAINTNDLGNIPFNFSLYVAGNPGATLGITNALAPNRTTLILETEPRDPSASYDLVLNAVVDACAGNALPDGTVVHVHSICNVLLPLTAVWRYDDVTDTNDIAANWAQTGYDDSGAPWKSGAGPFDAKRSANGAAGANCRDVTLFGLGNVGTCINLTSPLTGTNLVVANFRTHFTYGGNPSDAILQLSGQVDDGAVLYLNGTELERIRVPAGTLTRTMFATGGPADTDPSATYQYVAPAALLNGNNLLAVDLRQVNPTSSDLTMGLQVKAVTTVPLAQPTRLTIVLNPNGSVTISWNGPGTLICTSDVTLPRASWTVVAGATSPYTIAAGTLAAHRFYAVRLP